MRRQRTRKAYSLDPPICGAAVGIDMLMRLLVVRSGAETHTLALARARLITPPLARRIAQNLLKRSWPVDKREMLHLVLLADGILDDCPAPDLPAEMAALRADLAEMDQFA